MGQSNESGSGDEPMSNTGLGAPLRDLFGSGSMWPRLSQLAGDIGVWLGVSNTAQGGTSATDGWCGRCRAWQSGMIVTRGSYALSGGTVYKCQLAAGLVSASTVTPAAGTGADSVPWIVARTATVEDVDGYVYASGSALFDPNGYLAACGNGIGNAAPASWDLRGALISIGQGDRTVGTTRAQYAAALTNATQYLLTRGAQFVAVGFTCYGATAGLTAWYDAELVPGRADALAAMAGDKRVFAGANIYAELGVLPVSPANKATPGLKSDQLHMNNAALVLAADLWENNLVANGVF